MNENFCTIPFKELYVDFNNNYVTNCCIQREKITIDFNEFKKINWFEKFTQFNDIRKDFSNNGKPATCVRCWKLEEAGQTSYRNRFGYNHRGSNLEKVELSVIDIRLSNKCNLQCKMCSPECSDQIAKNIHKYTSSNDDDEFYDVSKLLTQQQQNFDALLRLILRTPSIRLLKFAGGESFIMDDLIKFLQKLVKHKKTDLDLFFLTNATTVNSKIIDLLKHFNKVEISCSIDSYGKWFEYQRFPAKWSVIEKNYLRLLDTNFKITLTPCWSHLNLSGLAPFLKWVKENPCAYLSFNEVTFPSFLNWQLIPLKYRDELIEELAELTDVDSEYSTFINRIKTEVRTITPQESKTLQSYVNLWNFNNKIRYEDMYPWASELLGK